MKTLIFIYCFLVLQFFSVVIIKADDFEQMAPVLDTISSKGVSSQENNHAVTTDKQDSAYKAALELKIPFTTRFFHDFQKSDHLWSEWINKEDESPWRNVMKGFENMPKDVFTPEGIELVQYRINRVNALSVPGKPFTEGSGIPLMGILREAGVLLGIIEDTSPEIKYSLGMIADVEIVIYSVQAKVIATIFKGTQRPGSYKITWNQRDDKGKKMPYGDYIAEVRIGTDRFVRKRIVIN